MRSMARLATGQHRAVEHVQSSEQGGRSVPLVVVRDALDVAGPHWQHRLGTLKRLALALFVHAQHQRVLRRTQIQVDDIA